MVDDLVAEAKEEVKTKNDCNTDIFENEKAIAAKTREKALLENSIADMTTKRGNLKDAIATLEAEVADAHVDQKAASEDRQAENRLFQQTVKDAKATAALLEKALGKLK